VIALDDVTSGYGTLQFCHALQPEFIKVDSEVTRGIARDPRRRAILKFLADLGKEFAFMLVAEGIESAEDLDVCATEGVGAAQGYFGAPAEYRRRRLQFAPGSAARRPALGLSARDGGGALSLRSTSGSTSRASFRPARRPRRRAREERWTSEEAGRRLTARSARATASA
jgi:EAL domain-containing protein (putative c-di-GMP-specific phosphodiesterase class I)